MIVASAPAFLQAFSQLAASQLASPRAVFLVAPDGFGLEAQSAADNAYMTVDARVDRERANVQHRGLVAAIQHVGVPVFVLPGIEGQGDGVFPNNVYGTTPGRFIVGAMRHEVRQREAARSDVRSLLGGMMERETIDLAQRGCVAELTGPLVIDRARRVGLCGMTPRVDDSGVLAMHEAFALELTYRFPLVASEYHTNVVLAILAGRAAVFHRASFVDPDTVYAIDRAYDGTTIELDDAEKAAFAANCIALTERDVFISATADRVLRPKTRARFTALGFVLHAIEVDEIEKAGGSVRCMIAEIY